MPVILKESACHKDLRDGEARANVLVAVVRCNVPPNVNLRFMWVEECTSIVTFRVLHNGFHQPPNMVTSLEHVFLKFMSLRSFVQHVLCQAVLKARHYSNTFGSQG